MIAQGRRTGLAEHRARVRAIAASLPIAIAACSAFGVDPPASPLDGGAGGDADAPSSDGGSDTEDRDALADADTSGDASSCAVIRDDFEGADWKPETKWIVAKSSTGASLDRAPNIPEGLGGEWSLAFETSAVSSFARLGQTIQQRCDLRFSAWLNVLARGATNSPILTVQTTDGSTLSVEMRGTSLALVEDGMVRRSVGFLPGQWLQFLFTYTMNRQVTLELGDNDTTNPPLEGKGRAKRLDFGLLGAQAGGDQILFDDVELQY